MTPLEATLHELKRLASPEAKAAQQYFGIHGVNSYGLTTPQLRKLAKQIGKNHDLALQLWKTGIHEARHVAVFIADPRQVTIELMEKWLKDFNSWDIVDNCCSALFDKTPFAFDKAMEWSARKKEFEKRAGFVLMAALAIHDKKAEDEKFIQFYPFMIRESGDDRNFVKKAINWALRQTGKRNDRLCTESIKVAKKIHKKGDPSSRWIASDALRELEKYHREGKIRNIGTP